MRSNAGESNEDGLGAMAVVSLDELLTVWYPLSYLGIPFWSTDEGLHSDAQLN